MLVALLIAALVITGMVLLRPRPQTWDLGTIRNPTPLARNFGTILNPHGPPWDLGEF